MGTMVAACEDRDDLLLPLPVDDARPSSSSASSASSATPRRRRRRRRRRRPLDGSVCAAAAAVILSLSTTCLLLPPKTVGGVYPPHAYAAAFQHVGRRVVGDEVLTINGLGLHLHGIRRQKHGRFGLPPLRGAHSSPETGGGAASDGDGDGDGDGRGRRPKSVAGARKNNAPPSASGGAAPPPPQRTETTYSLNRRISYLVASASSKRRGRRLTPRNAAKEASDILAHMEATYDANQLDPETCTIRPDTYTYTAVIDAWAKSGDRNAALEAERILDRMQACAAGKIPGYDHVRPNAVTFGAVMNAWAKSDDAAAPFRAERILDGMEKAYEKATRSTRTSTSTMSASDGGGDGDESNANEASASAACRPNTRCYNAAIDAWVRRANGSRKGSGAASRAHALLRRMERLSSSTPSTGGDEKKANGDAAHNAARPDSFSYSSVVNAYSRVGGPESARKAEELVRRMEELAYETANANADDENDPPLGRRRSPRPRSSVKPNSFAYTALINAFARMEGGEEGALKAEEVLRRMTELQRNGTNIEAGPNVYTYQGVLLAWANSNGGIKAARRTESILRHMHRLHDAGNRAVKPLTMCYNAVLEAWSNSGGGAAAAEHAESILWSMAAGPGPTPTPTTPSSSPASDAISPLAVRRNNNGTGTGTGTGTLVDLALRSDIFPDASSINHCIIAWGESGTEDAAENAERLLLKGFAALGKMMPKEETEKRRRRGGGAVVAPNVFSYNAVINAHVKSNKVGAARSAEAILYRLIELEGGKAKSKRGGRRVIPNAQSFAGIINLWCRSAEAGSTARASSLLEKMERLTDEGTNPYVKPNVVLYTTVISSWAKDTTDAEKGRKAQAIFDRMRARAEATGDRYLMPNGVTYNSLLHVWSTSSDANATAAHAEALLADMERQRRHGDEEGGNTDVTPTARTYNYVMKCLSKGANDKDAAAERVQELLEIMLGEKKFRRAGAGGASASGAGTGIVVRPDSFTFAAVVETWCESGAPHAGEKITSVLHTMEELFDTGAVTSGPHSIVYNRAMRFFYDRDGDGDVEAALRILGKMEEYSSAGGLKQVRPDGRTYAAVLAMLARRSGGGGTDTDTDRTAAARATEVLKRMIRLGAEPPAALHYNTVITCLARSQARNSAETAQELFEDMKSAAAAGHVAAKPDAATFLNLINAWARSGGGDESGRGLAAAAADRATDLLEEMLGDAHDIEPSRAVFNACLNALSKANAEEYALKGEALLRRMEVLSRTGGTRCAGLKPDTISYTSVLCGWAGCAASAAGAGGARSNKAPERAEKVLRHMEDLCEEAGNNRDDKVVRPDAIAYNTVLRAWAFSGDGAVAVERGEAILARMKSRCAGGNAEARPDSYTYKILLTLHAANGSPQEAERYLNFMEGEFRAGDRSMMPDLDCFKACSSAWEADGANDKAEELAKRLNVLYKKSNDDKKTPY